MGKSHDSSWFIMIHMVAYHYHITVSHEHRVTQGSQHMSSINIIMYHVTWLMLPDWLLILHLKVNLDQDYHWKVNIAIYIYVTTYSMYWFGLQMNVGFAWFCHLFFRTLCPSKFDFATWFPRDKGAVYVPSGSLIMFFSSPERTCEQLWVGSLWYPWFWHNNSK
jgi:hypothetical protein